MYFSPEARSARRDALILNTLIANIVFFAWFLVDHGFGDYGEWVFWHHLIIYASFCFQIPNILRQYDHNMCVVIIKEATEVTTQVTTEVVPKFPELNYLALEYLGFLIRGVSAIAMVIFCNPLSIIYCFPTTFTVATIYTYFFKFCLYKFLFERFRDTFVLGECEKNAFDYALRTKLQS